MDVTSLILPDANGSVIPKMMVARMRFSQSSSPSIADPTLNMDATAADDHLQRLLLCLSLVESGQAGSEIVCRISSTFA